MDKKFITYENFFLDEIMAIDSMFDLYIHLYNKRIDKLRELNIAPAFFGLTELALLELSVTKLSKLYDYHKDTINIKKLLNFIEQNIEVNFDKKHYDEVRAVIDEHRNELEKLKGKVEKLKCIRDQRLAHNNLENIRDEIDIWKKVDLKIGDIHELIKWISKVINRYRTIRNESYVALGATNKYDVDRLIDAITEYIK